jgi:Zn-finger nucleic acid-binding protein
LDASRQRGGDERAIDQLDRTSKEIFTKGSRSVLRNLLNGAIPGYPSWTITLPRLIYLADRPGRTVCYGALMVRKTSVTFQVSCPKCKVILYPFTTSGIQVDFCTSCSGVWLDQGELEKLYGSWGIVDIEGVAGEPSPDARARPEQAELGCPACPTVMVRMKVRGANLDACPACGGLWLDHGELGPALDSLGKDGDPDKIKKLAIAVATHRAQK